jgi:hypothetical protein
MNTEDVLRLSTFCMNVLQNGACDPTFESDLVRYADLLLSGSSSNHRKVIMDENFEAVIMYMAKLVGTYCRSVFERFFPRYRAA